MSVTNTNKYVLILKCTEYTELDKTINNTYEKIKLYKVNDDAEFKNNLNVTVTEPNSYSVNDKQYAVAFIVLDNNNENSTTYEVKKYYTIDEIDNFINIIENTINPKGTIIESDDSKFETKYIKNTSGDNEPNYNSINLSSDSVTEDIPNSKNMLFKNGEQIIVGSTQNTDQMILHLVSKMFGFEDIVNDLKKVDGGAASGGAAFGGAASGGAGSNGNGEENKKQKTRHAGKKRKSKQNTKKMNKK